MILACRGSSVDVVSGAEGCDSTLGGSSGTAISGRAGSWTGLFED